jgi:hypothetical protein
MKYGKDIMYVVLDDNGNFVFRGTYEDCKDWCEKNDKNHYRIWQ